MLDIETAEESLARMNTVWIVRAPISTTEAILSCPKISLQVAGLRDRLSSLSEE
jgi:hypothetical protein